MLFLADLRARPEPFSPTKVLQLDLEEGIVPEVDVAGYDRTLLLMRVGGQPVGCLRVACPGGCLRADAVRRAIAADPQVERRLRHATLKGWLLRRQPPVSHRPESWSIIICTRNRTTAVARCLDAAVAAMTVGGEILVVDNDPPSDATQRLVERYPVRYVREPRRGLNRARAAGARAARGEILLYTDDDAVVDPGWVPAVLEEFSSPRVGAVTGLTLPYELETPAQDLFERYGGHGRGFERRVFDDTVIAPSAAGLVGSGANMAIRRDLVLGLGLFDAELDVGTAAISGGDAYAFYRLLAEGHRIVYTPKALAWHEHRRDDAALRRLLRGYSVGAFAFLLRALLQHRDLRALEVGLTWFRRQHLWQMARASLRRPHALPLDLIIAEWRGAFAAPWAYAVTRRRQRPRRAAGVAPGTPPKSPGGDRRPSDSAPLNGAGCVLTQVDCSVVVPSRNRRDSLLHLLEALARQTHPLERVEVIIVLDGSTDGSAEALERWERTGRLPRLRHLSQPRAGQAAARMRGAEAARADVLVFLDDDVIPEPDLLASHLRRHRDGASIAVLGEAPIPRSPHDSWYLRWIGAWWEDHYHVLAQPGGSSGYQHFCAGNVSVRRDDFFRVGGFDASFSGYGGEDFDLGYRLMGAGVRFVHESRARAVHRHRATAMQFLRNLRQEGRQDVLLGRKHPSLRRGLRLMRRTRGARTIFTLPWAWAARGRKAPASLVRPHGMGLRLGMALRQAAAPQLLVRRSRRARRLGRAPGIRRGGSARPGGRPGHLRRLAGGTADAGAGRSDPRPGEGPRQ